MPENKTETDVEKIKKCLGSLIVKIAQSANSPISIDEAGELLQMINEVGKGEKL